MNLPALRRRVLEISYRRRLAHLGSCLTALPIIADIYDRFPDDTFVLSSGHAGLALYVVLEAVHGLDAEDLYERHGTHPSRSEADHIACSSGSLGHGLPIAVGMALAEPERRFHVLASDGECAEGSIWEALRLIHQLRIENLSLYVNANGWGAYGPVDLHWLGNCLRAFMPNTRFREDDWRAEADVGLDCLRGLKAHYHVLSEEEYREALEACEEGVSV